MRLDDDIFYVAGFGKKCDLSSQGRSTLAGQSGCQIRVRSCRRFKNSPRKQFREQRNDVPPVKLIHEQLLELAIPGQPPPFEKIVVAGGGVYPVKESIQTLSGVCFSDE